MQAPAQDWSQLGLSGKLALVAIGPFVSIGLFSMGSVLPRLGEAFAGTPGADLLVQLIGTLVAPVFAFASPLAGKLVNRFGIRAVYIGSVMIMAIGGAGPALCDNLGAILGLRVLLAIGVAGGFAAGISGTARLPDAQPPTLLGLNSFAGGVITLPLFPIVGALAEESWRLAFLAHLIVLPTILFALRFPGRDAVPTEAEEIPSGQSAQAEALLAGVPGALVIATALSGLGMVASSMYSPFFLASIGIVEPGKIGMVLSAMSLCSLSGSGSYGFVHRFVGTKGLLLLGLGGMSVGCLSIAMAQGLVVAIAGMGLLGAGISMFVPSAYAAAVESVGPGRNVPAAMGVLTLALYGTQMLFPAISSALGGRFGPAAVFLMLGGIMTVAFVLAFQFGRQALPPAAA